MTFPMPGRRVSAAYDLRWRKPAGCFHQVVAIIASRRQQHTVVCPLVEALFPQVVFVAMVDETNGSIK